MYIRFCGESIVKYQLFNGWLFYDEEQTLVTMYTPKYTLLE